MHRLLTSARSLLTGMRVAAGTSQTPRLRALDLTPFEHALEGLATERADEVGDLLDHEGVAGLDRLLRAGEVSSVELTLVCLARVRDHDERLRTMVELNPAALEEAAAADARRQAGRPASALDGIPVALKDNIETAGPMHTTLGAAALLDHVARADAPLVTTLRDAGLVLLGKGNLSELAGALSNRPGFSAVGGQTVNPHGDAYSPGGSSSGAAAAVAAGLVPLAIGTETSGSLVAPASFNGVAAVKPTVGVVPAAGVAPLLGSQDCPGPVARSVADAAALLAVITEPPVLAPATGGGLDGVRIGVLRPEVLAQRSPFEDTTDNGAVLDRAAAALQAAGADVVDVEPTSAGNDKAGLDRRLTPVVLGGLRHETAAYLAEATGGSLDGHPMRSLQDLATYNLADARHRMPTGQLFPALALAQGGSAQEHTRAAAELTAAATEALERLAATSGATLFLSLSNCHAPLYAAAGVPAVTVPLGRRSGGMPVGATLFASRRGADADVVGAALALEAAAGPRPLPPRS